MAWAEKLPSGRYRGGYRDGAGHLRYLTTLYVHKARAERAAAAAEEKERRRLVADPEAYKKPWGEWCDEWWPTRIIEASTRTTDAGRRRKHLDPRWSGVPIGSIRRHDVRVWITTLMADGMTPSTGTRVLALFATSLAAAVDAELIETNPAARIKLPPPSQGAERYLTRAEFALVLGHLRDTDARLIAEMLAYTGLRWGELAALHLHRVDFDRGMIHVVEAYDEKNHLMKAYPKGKRQRFVPLTADLVDKLGKLEHEGESCSVPHVVGKCRGPLLITGAQGGVLRNSNWYDRFWEPAVAASKVGHVRIHDLRHTYASWLLQAGYSLAKVGKLLGHVSASTTQRYAHLEDTSRDDVLAALGAPIVPVVPKEKMPARTARQRSRGQAAAS